MLDEKSIAARPGGGQPAPDGGEERQQSGPSKRVRRMKATAQRDRLIGAVAVIIVLIIWQAVVQTGMVNPLFLSSPTLIIGKFLQVLHEGTLRTDLTVSGEEFIMGYAGSVVIGVLVGIAIGWYEFVAAALQPFVAGLYTTPKIALIPLLIIWLGIGIWSKVAVIFLASVFLVLVNTEVGVRSADESLLKAARSFGASDRQIFTTVVLPGCVPFLLAGFRLAIGTALIGVVVGELYAATAGVGYELAVAGETFQTSLAFVYIIILALTGIVLQWLLRVVEKKFESWRPEHAR